MERIEPEPEPDVRDAIAAALAEGEEAEARWAAVARREAVGEAVPEEGSSSL